MKNIEVDEEILRKYLSHMNDLDADIPCPWDVMYAEMENCLHKDCFDCMIENIKIKGDKNE